MNDKKVYPWKTELGSNPCCISDTIISINNLSLYYGKKCAFKDISIEVNKNCITGIIGPSGCGKSSFIQCINRLADHVDGVEVTGDIFFHGQNVYDSRVNLINLRKKIGLIFQVPTPLPLSIYENIALPLKEHGFDDISKRVERALVDVGLWVEVKDKLKDSAFKLSGGQKQRLCIARSIALEPEVLLLDEPCSSLDPISSEVIEKLLLNLKSRFTILIVTHNLAQARRVCDHLCAFWYDLNNQHGFLLECGTSHDLFENSSNEVLKDYVGGARG